MTIRSLLRKPKGLLALALLAFALAPTTVWGDIGPTRTYVHRLHRIGYEVFPSVWHNAPCLVAFALFVLVAVLIFKKPLPKKAILGLALFSVILFCFVIAFHSHSCLFTTTMVADNENVIPPNGVISRREGGDRMGNGTNETVHVRENGWVYADAISLENQEKLRMQLALIKDPLLDAINETGLKAKFVSEIGRGLAIDRKSCLKILSAVFNAHPELKIACHGIPIEYIAEAIPFYHTNILVGDEENAEEKANAMSK